MNDHRAKPSDLCMMDARPFMQGWCYRTTLPIRDVLHDQFFMPVGTMLRCGDSITIGRFTAYDGEMIESADVSVLASGATGVRVALKGDIRTFDLPAKPEPAPMTERVYSAAKEFGGGFLVKDDLGNVIDSFKTKKDAEAFAANLNGERLAA